MKLSSKTHFRVSFALSRARTWHTEWGVHCRRLLKMNFQNKIDLYFSKAVARSLSKKYLHNSCRVMFDLCLSRGAVLYVTSSHSRSSRSSRRRRDCVVLQRLLPWQRTISVQINNHCSPNIDSRCDISSLTHSIPFSRTDSLSRQCLLRVRHLELDTLPQ